ncbi:unnamed protein product [Wuchereria bancrofti]|uniref:Uncharacterized protein n=2 Tax=Wuchereria bancrofti TaxID=6293 RepID=A0A3P7EGZ1_WUCBA|nr:unnamed protein product [Wuchereria bancrofti]
MSYALFFNDNSNCSLHHGEVNITDRPICAQKGLSCPALYTAMQLVSHITTIADLIIIPLLVYLSIAKVKDGLFKYFTLNLMAICSMMTTADLVADIINIINLFVDVGENKKHLYQIRYWAQNCLRSGNIWFHALALYAAVVCYLPYANPIFYTKHFVNKSQKLHYVILHISLFLWNSCIYLIRKQFSIVMPYHLTHLILFTALFIVAVMVKFCKLSKKKVAALRLNFEFDEASVEICKYKPAGVSAVYVRKLRRKRLFSFVIYSYVTEIVVLPSFGELCYVASCVLVICASIRCQCQINATVFYSVMNVIIRIFYEVKFIEVSYR